MASVRSGLSDPPVKNGLLVKSGASVHPAKTVMTGEIAAGIVRLGVMIVMIAALGAAVIGIAARHPLPLRIGDVVVIVDRIGIAGAIGIVP